MQEKWSTVVRLDVSLDGDRCWPDLKEKFQNKQLEETERVAVALLPRGLQSGKASMTIRFDLEGGRVVLGQVSFEHIQAAIHAMEARLELQGGTH